MTRRNDTAVAAMTRALHVADHTSDELAAIAGISKRAVQNWLISARAGEPLVFISAWRDDSRGYPTIPAYRWGLGQGDAPRVGMTAAQKQRAYRERQRTAAAGFITPHFAAFLVVMFAASLAVLLVGKGA